MLIKNLGHFLRRTVAMAMVDIACDRAGIGLACEVCTMKSQSGSSVEDTDEKYAHLWFEEKHEKKTGTAIDGRV